MWWRRRESNPCRRRAKPVLSQLSYVPKYQPSPPASKSLSARTGCVCAKRGQDGQHVRESAKENPDAGLASTGVFERPTSGADALHRIFQSHDTCEGSMRRDDCIGHGGNSISPHPRRRIHHGLMPRYGIRWLRRPKIHDSGFLSSEFRALYQRDLISSTARRRFYQIT